MIRVSTQTGMAELLLSGCTTTSDHLYLYPNGSRLDDTHRRRRARSACASTPPRRDERRRESTGGLPPDALVEDEDGDPRRHARA